MVAGDGNVVISHVTNSHITVALEAQSGQDDAAGSRIIRVLLSSTAEDLGAWREAAIAALLHMVNVKPVNQEAFGSRAGSTVDECRRLAATADLLIVIVAYRYGWVPSIEEGGDGQLSITALEVEAAKSANPPVPVLAFMVDEDYVASPAVSSTPR